MRFKALSSAWSKAPVPSLRAHCFAAKRMATSGAYAGLVHLEFEPSPSDADLLAAAVEHVSHRLYVTLSGDWSTGGLDQANRRLSQVYRSIPGSLDARVLLPARWGAVVGPGCFAPEVEVLIGSPSQETLLVQLNNARAAKGLCGEVRFVPVDIGDPDTHAEATRRKLDSTVALVRTPEYNEVVLGGTFDRLHSGHKLLLSAAFLCATKRVLVGVTDASMLVKKVGAEVIQPIEYRNLVVTEFLAAVKPGLQVESVGISDPFGPAIVERSLSCIVVSQESAKGGAAVNKRRLQNGLDELAVVTIDCVDGASDESDATGKLSSSGLRKSVYGHFRAMRTSGHVQPTLPSGLMLLLSRVGSRAGNLP